jgi:protein TonB
MVDDSGVMLRFRNDIQAVVRAAATMPEAAVLQHRSGRAQVRFSYLDGQVGAVELAQTSRSRVLDDAALAAVRRAHYPPPPPPLRGRRLTLLAWIDFALRPASPG